jgi:tRNA(Ile)-lysidine synthase
VDHGWRAESRAEAEHLQQLANQFQVPFHLKTLEPSTLTGNLEEACRQERYAFFAQLCQQQGLQAIVTGHHRDDQAETVFKRLLEGAHWSRWGGLKKESEMKGERLLRPLLTLSKREILDALQAASFQGFDDRTNTDERFLRARLRETIFPWLNQVFGKQVQTSLVYLGEEAQELSDYFVQRLTPLLQVAVKGPWGLYFDLQSMLPTSRVEVKYLLRLLCAQQGFFLSRPQIEQAAHALQKGQANRIFAKGTHELRIDRRRLFVQDRSQIILKGQWRLQKKKVVYSAACVATSWKEGWQGCLTSYLPLSGSHYALELPQEGCKKRAHWAKKWNAAQVPAFLYSYFPLLWQDAEICHEFLTGKLLCPLEKGSPCWKISLLYEDGSEKQFE